MMLNGRVNENKTKEISGLALALLCDKGFTDLFDLCEGNNRPQRKFRVRKSLRSKKHARQIVHKEIFLGRF